MRGNEIARLPGGNHELAVIEVRQVVDDAKAGTIRMLERVLRPSARRGAAVDRMITAIRLDREISTSIEVALQLGLFDAT